MEVYADGSLVAEARDAATGTVTFRDPSDSQSDDETESGGENDSTAETSVDVSFGFEVDK